MSGRSIRKKARIRHVIQTPESGVISVYRKDAEGYRRLQTGSDDLWSDDPRNAFGRRKQATSGSEMVDHSTGVWVFSEELDSVPDE